MSIAVVFDSAGTLLRTFRVAKDIRKGEIIEDVETTTLAYSCEERALVTLYLHSMDVMEAPAEQLLSEFLTSRQIGFGIACAWQVVTAEDVAAILYHDRLASVGDLQDCIRRVWGICKREVVVALASGVMINQMMEAIEYTITSGGRPFGGARETIRELHKMGIASYVASGDRTDKLVRMADYLGIPHDNVHGVATPSIKAQVVRDLKSQYDTVVMVGDGINDLTALREADVAILSEQQSCNKPQALIDAADHIVRSVTEVADIVRKLQCGTESAL
ncbi:MAG: HAD-IC family P-type ATPase [Methanomicrobiaceae archaeon]|nr:HAD-IC family P-type ATPase [Methanomicrobiaceae archaeon]